MKKMKVKPENKNINCGLPRFAYLIICHASERIKNDHNVEVLLTSEVNLCHK